MSPADGLAHELQPGEWEFAVRLGIVEWDNSIFEKLIEAGGIDVVLKVDAAVVDFGTDGPAVVAVEPFAPPTIEHAKIESAVRWRFHAAGATGFEGAKRVV